MTKCGQRLPESSNIPIYFIGPDVFPTRTKWLYANIIWANGVNPGQQLELLGSLCNVLDNL